jgi:cold-inducible RNA-binding protein
MKIYVGNLSFNTSEDQLRSLFEAHGQVASASLAMDRETGRPRGFGFVEMNDDGQAKAAMTALNGTEVDGRQLTVNEARPRENRGGFAGGGSRGGAGGGGGGGGGGGARRGGGGGRGGW